MAQENYHIAPNNKDTIKVYADGHLRHVLKINHISASMCGNDKFSAVRPDGKMSIYKVNGGFVGTYG